MNKGKLSVLIVDDNRPFTKRMMRLLNDVEDICTIDIAHSYEETFALLDKKPDFMLLDIQLPQKNGLDILKHLKNSGSDCEVIMLSNFAGDYYREYCRRLGASFFLDKSHDFDLVPETIKGIALQQIDTSMCPEKTAA